MTFTVDAWQPAGGSYQDISEDSNYGGRFLAQTPFSFGAQAQFEGAPATAGFLRGVLATTQEFTVTLFKADSFSSQTFHTNVRAWFSPYETARGSGYLRIVWEDGSTQLRIPARVTGLAPRTDHPDGYTVTLKAEQPYFEETSETADSSSPVSNAGNVRCGCEVEFTGASISGCTNGTASGSYTNRLLKLDVNSTTNPASTGRIFVNGVPTPWTKIRRDVIVAIVSGENPFIEYIPGYGSNDPLQDTLTAEQISSSDTTSGSFNYVDMRISTLLADDRLGGLWRPLVYLPSTFIAPASGNGWGYYAEDTRDGFTLHLNDTPSFGDAGDWAYNAVYLDSGGPSISAVTAWDVTLAGFTGSEARASLLGRRRGSDVWQEVWGSSTDGSTTVTQALSGGYTELMWTIVPLADTLTTDPSLEINPGSRSRLSMGGGPTMSGGTYRRLDGAWTNSTTGQSVTFDEFVTRGQVDLHFPGRRVDWGVELGTAGHVSGFFELSDPERGIELSSGSNTISNATGGTWNVKHRSGYA